MARNFRSLLLVVLLANNLSKIVATFLYLLLLLFYSIFLYITTCVTHREVAQFFLQSKRPCLWYYCQMRLVLHVDLETSMQRGTFESSMF